jgi:hypothetical protein
MFQDWSSAVDVSVSDTFYERLAVFICSYKHSHATSLGREQV